METSRVQVIGIHYFPQSGSSGLGCTDTFHFNRMKNYYYSTLELPPCGVPPQALELEAPGPNVLAGVENLAHLGAAPSVFWSQTRRIAVFLMRCGVLDENLHSYRINGDFTDRWAHSCPANTLVPTLRIARSTVLFGSTRSTLAIT